MLIGDLNSRCFAWAILAILLPGGLAAAQAVPGVVEATLGSTRNVHACGKLLLAGQPTEQDLNLAKQQGVQRVISLREDREIRWDEAAAVERAGMEFVHIPFRAPESLTDEVFDRIRKLLQDDMTSTLLHCGSASRVGAVWLTHRVLDQKVPLEQALTESKTIGLRSAALEERAREYILKQSGE